MDVFTNWRKSRRSGATDNCVEVAWGADRVGVRDSKDPTGPILNVGSDTWRAFVAGIRQGRFDLD
jgi:hypothetical protein